MNCQIAGGPAVKDERLTESSGEMKPPALTQTRIRLANTWRSTGKVGCRLAPRTQSYLEHTRPRSTQMRAMPPRPLVRRARSVLRVACCVRQGAEARKRR